MPLSKKWQIGSFRSHHSLDETRNLVVLGLSGQITLSEIVPRSPGIMDSIYFSEIAPYRVSLAAGNSTRLLWEFTVDLAMRGTTVEGAASFDRKRIIKYGGNVNDILLVVPRVLRDASVDVQRWKG